MQYSILLDAAVRLVVHHFGEHTMLEIDMEMRNLDLNLNYCKPDSLYWVNQKLLPI